MSSLWSVIGQLEATLRAFTPSSEDKLADPRVTTETPGLTETQSRPADIFTTAAVLGRSGILQCSGSSSAAAARGDAAQAASLRQTSHYRRGIFDLRAQAIVYRPPRLDSGRPTTSSTHTKHAASSIHRIIPQRATNVSKSPPPQMETRNPICPPTKSSNDASSSAQNISEKAMGFWLD